MLEKDSENKAIKEYILKTEIERNNLIFSYLGEGKRSFMGDFKRVSNYKILSQIGSFISKSRILNHVLKNLNFALLDILRRIKINVNRNQVIHIDHIYR